MNIKQFDHSDADYDALLAISEILRPDEVLTMALIRQEEKGFSAEINFTRYLGEIDGATVAYGASWQTADSASEPHQFSSFVHPAHQNSSIPRKMHDFLVTRIQEAQPSAIISEAKADETYRTQLLEQDGFDLKMRFPRSRLPVQTCNLTKLDELAARLAEQGIELITLTDVMARDPDWQRGVWQMFTIIDQDVPYPDPQQSVPFETYKTFYEGDLFRADSWAIAWDSNQEGAQRCVGMSVVNVIPTKPNTLFAGITGVVPSHRRRKIAMALKLCSASYAREQGYAYIETDNEEDNPMYALNLKLGFEPLPAWVYFKKQLQK